MSGVRFHTVDLVIDELHRSPYKRPLIDQLIEEDVLHVAAIPSEEMSKLVQFYARYANHTNLSLVDCSVMRYAKINNFRLLTGDKKLRNHAVDEGVIVSGLLWVEDLFVNEGIVRPDEMAERLGTLLEVNSRLPRKLIEEKIRQLKG